MLNYNFPNDLIAENYEIKLKIFNIFKHTSQWGEINLIISIVGIKDFYYVFLNSEDNIKYLIRLNGSIIEHWTMAENKAYTGLFPLLLEKLEGWNYEVLHDRVFFKSLYRSHFLSRKSIS